MADDIQPRLALKISDIGEKRLISEFVRPFFNASNDVSGVGDDCAMLQMAGPGIWLFSTDRVPADLIAFRLGILDYEGLGKYLAFLNISDIAACGGRPMALLLNLGLPNDLEYPSFKSLCKGFRDAAEHYSCRVLGGDISSSSEISISATSIGIAQKDRVLTRRHAQEGDSIFISRPLGLTPTAFAYLLRCQSKAILSTQEVDSLRRQFTDIYPLVSIGIALSESGNCSSCMDNTDGVGQSLLELSESSGVCFVVNAGSLHLDPMIRKVADDLGDNPIELAFSAGADFSLVGTLKGTWSQADVSAAYGSSLEIIGHVEKGGGVTLDSNSEKTPLRFSGWNYFRDSARTRPENPLNNRE
jgi:thiamine-monophosphate kinase